MAGMFAFANDKSKEELKLQRNQQNQMQARGGEFAFKFSISTLC